MKSLIFNLLTLFSLNATNVVANEITAEQVTSAIVRNDFDFITDAIMTRQINPNELFNGKTLLIIAVEDDNAEMINHLVRLGARLSTVGVDGYRPMEIAQMQQKIHAQAEIIVITS